MPVFVVLASLKGGAGKSAVSKALAVEWHVRGRRVCLVCLDVKQRSSHKWGDRRKANNVPVELRPTVIAFDDETFADQVDAMVGSFEIVIVDMPGSLSAQLIRAVEKAHLVLVPTSPDRDSIESLDETLPKLKGVRKERRRAGSDLDVAILITLKQKGTLEARVARKRVEEVPDIDVLETELHRAPDYNRSNMAGVGPTVYDPSSQAAGEFRQLVDELDKRLRLPRVKVRDLGAARLVAKTSKAVRHG